jgi:ABC-type lipoprotein export system ATPase subunit
MSQRPRWTGRPGHEVLELLCELAQQHRVPILMVTNDPRIVGLADRVEAIEDGWVV